MGTISLYIDAGLFGANGTLVRELGPPAEEQRAAFFEPIARTLAFPPQPEIHHQQQVPPQVWAHYTYGNSSSGMLNS